jgi:hypothetical protein
MSVLQVNPIAGRVRDHSSSTMCLGSRENMHALVCSRQTARASALHKQVGLDTRRIRFDLWRQQDDFLFAYSSGL